MPIKFSPNNRVLPANSRAVDIAKSAVDRILDVQARRYQNAFEVQGYNGILYNRLTKGVPCQCRSKAKGLPTAGLQTDGKASSGMINDLLTGGLVFRIGGYGEKPANTKPYAKGSDPTPTDTYTNYKVDAGQLVRQVVETPEETPRVGKSNHPYSHLPSLTESDEPPGFFDVLDESEGQSKGMAGTPFDVWSKDGSHSATSTVIPDGVGPRGPIEKETLEDLLSDFDTTAFGVLDVSCPICFGSGYVGGFSVMNGWRTVLTWGTPGASFGEDGFYQPELEIPAVHCTTATFENVLLPKFARGVDSLRAFARSKVLACDFYVDDTKLYNDYDLLQFCDGTTHRIELLFSEPVDFTHLEIQVNQSAHAALFEFPKITKSSVQTLLENTDPFQLVLSPLVPLVRPLDIICDSTYGKVLQVKSTNPWNDKRHRQLGWECEVRPVQPSELFDLLPRRRPTESPKSVSPVRENGNGNRRT